ncbi:MAG: hypothetical protein D6754_04160, partial [Alphaproteobacteria bacterium]
MADFNPYQRAIIRNADWFIAHQSGAGAIDLEGDEFYAVRGDATLVGHSVTVRMYAHALTGAAEYRDSARASLEWLAERQDAQGGWKHHAAFTLDGAQCVFEGFDTYRRISGEERFADTALRAARRMVSGTIDAEGRLLLPNIIEIGEYAHFALLAWKSTGLAEFRTAAETILGHIQRNFDAQTGCWRPFDAAAIRRDLPARLIRPLLRFSAGALPLRGRLMARMADRMLPLIVGESHAQYAMSMMDAEALLDTLDGSCRFPELRAQTATAIGWVTTHCAGPFPGSVVESCPPQGGRNTYPVRLLNDTKMAALWPAACLLLACCGMNDA